jgi:TatD DNase family protein
MEFIDTHSHLFLPEFDSDRDPVICHAIAQSVNKIVLPNIDVETLPKVTDLCKKFPQNCFPALGLHPTSVKENYTTELESIINSISNDRPLAIGESGIDLYWDKTFFKEQCDAFSVQIDLAKSMQLPIIIHSRDSFDEIIKILGNKTGSGLTGIFHSFSGTLEQARTIIELGFKMGINGVVTFKNSQLPEVLKQIPLNEIVLETDAPYLTPTPNRGKRNESAYLIYTARKIAEIKNTSLEIVAETTTQTAKKLFNFK